MLDTAITFINASIFVYPIELYHTRRYDPNTGQLYDWRVLYKQAPEAR